MDRSGFRPMILLNLRFSTHPVISSGWRAGRPSASAAVGIRRTSRFATARITGTGSSPCAKLVNFRRPSRRSDIAPAWRVAALGGTLHPGGRMIHRRYAQVSGAALLTLALAIFGCARKSGNESSQAPDTNPPGGEQSEAAKQASREHGQKGDQQSTAGSRDQGGPGDAGQGSATDRSSQQPEAAQARNYTLDAGSKIVVRTVTALSTKTAKAGERFEATLERPLVVGDHIVAPRGTSVFGQVTVSDPSGKLKGSSYLGVQLTAIKLPGGDRIGIQTGTREQISKGTGKRTAEKVGIGAGLGAVIGAIAGGGKGAAVGAGGGGAAGGGVAYATGGNPAVIPSESVLTFQLSAPVTVTARE